MKRKNILIGLGIIIVIIVVTWTIFSDMFGQTLFQKESMVLQEGSKKEMISLVIDNNEGAPKTFEIEFNEGITALDLLKKQAEELNMTLRTKTYDIGTLIEVIGDKENGQDGKYWMYYVNEELPTVAVDKKEIKSGDKIKFKFEASPF